MRRNRWVRALVLLRLLVIIDKTMRGLMAGVVVSIGSLLVEAEALDLGAEGVCLKKEIVASIQQMPYPTMLRDLSRVTGRRLIT